MPYHFNVLRKTSFALWVPGAVIHNVNLILAIINAGSPITVQHLPPYNLSQTALGLWTLPANATVIQPNKLYHYWYDVTVNQGGSPRTVRITDPFATTVDWRILAKPADPNANSDDYYPAGTFVWDGKEIVVADVLSPDSNNEPTTLGSEPYPIGKLPENDQLVIYELPTAWMREAKVGSRDAALGSFCDVNALLDKETGGANLPELPILAPGTSYFTELGINAIELLPPADSIYPRQWGYGTSNFNAPDFDLGFPQTYSNPAPNRDLAKLVKEAHASGIRVIADVVMGFGKSTSYRSIAFDSFFINPQTASDTAPDVYDKYNSRGIKELRNGYGADSFRYAKKIRSYDPLSGEEKDIYPSRAFLLACQERWMTDFHLDGFRLDSVENVANWDFVEEFKEAGHAIHAARYPGTSTAAARKSFLCVGEELTEPVGLIAKDPDGSSRLDGLWNEHFKPLVRAVILGKGKDDNLEWTIRKAIDPRISGKYTTLTETVLYLTSHDVEGTGNERLYNYLQSQGLPTQDILRRSKLAFTMLLTAIGIPMILAGDEFGDEHDLWATNPFDWRDNRKAVTHEGGKQVDPVNFSRLRGDGNAWRRELKDHVARLIKLRTSHPSLRTDDVHFWFDNYEGKNVMSWVRGKPETGKAVVVVANFSGYQSRGQEYVVQNWPRVPAGTKWREATQDRDAPDAGREPVFGWEAKVFYTV